MRKATTNTGMYAALDLGLKTIQAVLKRDDSKIIKEAKVEKQADLILQFLRGTNAAVVMESGYNHQFLYDLLKENHYDVKVAHPLMVKARAYAKVKTDKVDARTLADLLRMNMVPKCYIPDSEIRDIRDLARRHSKSQILGSVKRLFRLGRSTKVRLLNFMLSLDYAACELSYVGHALYYNPAVLKLLALWHKKRVCSKRSRGVCLA